MRLAHLTLGALLALPLAGLGVAACTDDAQVDGDYPVSPGIGASSVGATGAGAGEGGDDGISGPNPDAGPIGIDGTGSVDGGIPTTPDGTGSVDGGAPDGDFTPLEDAS